MHPSLCYVALTYFSLSVRNNLNATFGERWIRCGCPVHWRAQSPEPMRMDYFWGGGEISWLRNFHSQSRRPYNTYSCSGQGNPTHTWNVWECSNFHAAKVWGLHHMWGEGFNWNTSFDMSSTSLLLLCLSSLTVSSKHLFCVLSLSFISTNSEIKLRSTRDYSIPFTV